jgi:hypothetical protein
MSLKKLFMSAAAAAVLASLPGSAQVAPDLVAGPGIGAGPAAPKTPAGTVIIGNNLWVGDEAQGLRHYIPADPNNTDPLNTGQLQFDSTPNWSVGGGSCALWCSVGQAAQDGSTRAYLAVYDHTKGQPGNFGGGGIWMITFPSLAELNIGVFWQASPVASSLGLSGDLPTAVALGPEGKLYVGFLKNGNIKRVVNPSAPNGSPTQTVESVGGTPSGRPMRAMAFLGADLYIATDQGLAVVHNAATCIGNTGGCGNAAPVVDGLGSVAHVGLTTDGASKVYFSAAGSVYRYTPADKRVVLVSTGFAFSDAHDNMLTLDPFGNLWVGDDPTDFNFSGRLWRIPAASLATVQ